MRVDARRQRSVHACRSAAARTASYSGYAVFSVCETTGCTGLVLRSERWSWTDPTFRNIDMYTAVDIVVIVDGLGTMR